MPNKKENERVDAALRKVIAKIERNQQGNGTWATNGWAPVHSQSLAMQGLNKSKQAGIKVSGKALVLAQENAKRQFDPKNNSFAKGGAAGVDLYASGATIGSLQSSIETDRRDKIAYSKILKTAPSASPQWARARTELQRIDDTEELQKRAVGAVSNRLQEKGFIAGFGCNGGEEFLSYMQISDTLRSSNSKEWPDWDQKITANINHVQNPDGSWMGQHCITSRTFCTAAALLVLMSDRADATQNIARASDDDVEL